jgi:hypothetical protein
VYIGAIWLFGAFRFRPVQTGAQNFADPRTPNARFGSRTPALPNLHLNHRFGAVRSAVNAVCAPNLGMSTRRHAVDGGVYHRHLIESDILLLTTIDAVDIDHLW